MSLPSPLRSSALFLGKHALFATVQFQFCILSILHLISRLACASIIVFYCMLSCTKVRGVVACALSAAATRVGGRQCRQIVPLAFLLVACPIDPVLFLKNLKQYNMPVCCADLLEMVEHSLRLALKNVIFLFLFFGALVYTFALVAVWLFRDNGMPHWKHKVCMCMHTPIHDKCVCIFCRCAQFRHYWQEHHLSL